jgi:Family of unknown function (DUF5819)
MTKKLNDKFRPSFVTLDYIGVGAVFALFGLHVVFTASYLMPPNPLKNKVSSVVQSYMGNLFYQNWHLFSPNPGIRYSRIEVACSAGIQAKPEFNWEDIESQKQRVHEATRILGVSKSLQYYRHAGDTLWNRFVAEYQNCKITNPESKECIKSSKTKLESSAYFKLIDRYANDFCSRKDSSPGFKFRLTRSNPVAFSKRANREESQISETLSFATHSHSEVQNYDHVN